MTIQTIPDNARAISYVASGGETTFAIPWPFYAATDIELRRTVAAVTTVLSQPADYTVSGAGNQAGGSVTLAVAATAGHRYTIVSVQPFSRTSAYQDGQALQAASLNADANRLWVAIQQLRDRVDRAVRGPITEATLTAELPPAVDRANRLLGFDSTGQPVAITPNPGNLAITPFGESLISAANAPAVQTLLDVPSQADLSGLQSAAVLRNGSQAMTGRLLLAQGAAYGFGIDGDPTTGIVSDAAGNLRMRSGGADRLSIVGNTIEAHVPLTVPAATAASDAAQLGQIGAWLRDNRVVIQERLADGTSAGTATAGGWQQRGLALAEVLDSGGLASVSAATFTLAAGTWDILMRQCFGNMSGGARGRLFNVTAGAAVAGSVTETASAGNTATYNVNHYAEARFRVTLAAAATFRLEYIVQATASLGLGVHDGVTAGEEIYSTVDALRVAA